MARTRPGPDADKTFYAQSTYVQPVIGKKDAYIAMFDRWKKKDLEDSRYVWLPVLIKDGKITIPWHEKWDFSILINKKKNEHEANIATTLRNHVYSCTMLPSTFG